jgi:hypothetical protein
MGSRRCCQHLIRFAQVQCERVFPMGIPEAMLLGQSLTRQAIWMNLPNTRSTMECAPEFLLGGITGRIEGEYQCNAGIEPNSGLILDAVDACDTGESGCALS